MTTRTQALPTCLFGIRQYTWNDGQSPCIPDAVSIECSGGEGVVMNDTPKTFVENPTDQSHAIVVKDLMDSENTLIIPLEPNGVTSRFLVRTPTLQEFEVDDNPLIIMTGESRMGPPHFGLVAVRGFHDQLEGTYTRF